MDAAGFAIIQNFHIDCIAETSPCTTQAVLCVDILENAKAIIETTPPANNGIVQVCAGQEVFFENQSEEAEYFIWDFGTEETFTGTNVSFIYDTPGTYEAFLIAQNECLCNDTTSVTIEVSTALVPEISCTGTICSGEIITYTVDADCAAYNWNITNGTITDGGGTNDDFVTVDWGSSILGNIQLTLAGCSEDFCPDPIEYQVSIVAPTTIIEGPNKVCRGEIARYTIPEFRGTTFDWTVSNAGTISSGNGSNSIVVEWDQDAPLTIQWVRVEYENCYLECGGEALLDVAIRDKFYASGPIEACAGGSSFFEGRKASNDNPALCNWFVYDNNDDLHWQSTTPTSMPEIFWPDEAGRFRIEIFPATPDDFCVDQYTLLLETEDRPPTPTNISGETTICLGQIYSYHAVSDVFNTRFLWEITDGSNVYTNEGPSINVNWGNSPPYQLSLQQLSLTPLACPSDAITQELFLIPGFSITGDTDICLEAITTFETEFYPNTELIWSITPQDAGTIIEEATPNSIDVLWHKTGNATVTLDQCGLSQTYNIAVQPKPEPVIVAPLVDLCPNEPISITVAEEATSYQWFNENGTLISTEQSISITTGFYQVVVTDEFGCTGSDDFQRDEPIPAAINISSPDFTTYCPDTGMSPPTLYGLDTDEGYTYEWYYNGNPTGNTSGQIYADMIGTYYLEVTDINNCSYTSNSINVNTGCVSGTCIASGQIGFQPMPSAYCTQYNFQNLSSGYIPGSLSWNFDDPTSGNNSSTELEPFHEFSASGHYLVTLQGLLPEVGNPGGACVGGLTLPVTVAASANFDATIGCLGTSTYFSDKSDFVVDNGSITNWLWNFDDPTSGTENTSTEQNPDHIFNATGLYNINLTITHSNGCISEITKTIEILDLPPAEMTTSEMSCELNTVAFSTPQLSPATTYQWNFGDPASGAANTSEISNTYHTYNTAGNYQVTLTVKNRGCENTITQSIEIIENNLIGNIDFSAPSPICEGETITLSAPPGATSWLWSDDSTTDNVLVSQSSVYTVSLTDDFGCSYTTPQAVVDVLPTPVGTVRLIEYDEFGQASEYFYNNYSTCEGADVFLEVAGSEGNSFSWSTGESTTEIIYSEDRGNQLTTGIYDFTVTITDNTSGCSITEAFNLSITALPDPPLISSNPSGILCNGTTSILTIQNPIPDHTYVWSNGAIGQTIITNTPGLYSVKVYNPDGCENTSEEIEIFIGPEIINVPSGCFTHCNPDTLCMPNIPNIVSWQWYVDDLPVPAPNGTTQDLVATQSGDYHAVLTDANGCTATSGTLSLDLLDAFGNLEGLVYFDVNDNGIIDPADTLMHNVSIELSDGTNVLDTGNTGNNGAYAFPGIPSTNYTLNIDPSSLPPSVVPYEGQQFSILEGCDDEEEVLWLCHLVCATNVGNETLIGCSGDSIAYQNNMYPTGTTQEVTFTNISGCDTTVMLTIDVFEIINDTVQGSACSGNFYDYNENQIPAGTTENFPFIDDNGCNALATVTVTELLPSFSNLQIDTCGVESIFYQGFEILVGIPTDVSLTNSIGCDSIVTIFLNSTSASTGTLVLDGCEGDTIFYENINIPVGQQAEIVYELANDCDSVLTIFTNPIQIATATIDLNGCEGDTIFYENTSIPVGQQAEIIYELDNGCDSILTIFTNPIFPDNLLLEIDTCQGGSFNYQDSTILAGNQASFNFTNQWGCDSIVTVQVNETTTPLFTIEENVCLGEFYNYNNIDFTAGTDTSFYFTDQNGCDSIVRLILSPFPAVVFDPIPESSCWNDTNGKIAIENIAGGLAPYSYSLDGILFEGTPAIFENLGAGEYEVFVQDENMCIYQRNIEIEQIAALEISYESPVLSCNEDSTRITVSLNSGVPEDVNWQWSNNSNNNYTYVQTPGIYEVVASNACESITERITVASAIEANEGNLIYIPNAFSPNGDGINDYFVCAPAQGAEVLAFEIHLYDRWGAVLFESYDHNVGWNGTYQDKDLNPGVYVYWMRARIVFCNEEMVIFREGDVTVLR